MTTANFINPNAPSGLTPRKHMAGGESQRIGYYSIAGALASNIYRGSAVKPPSSVSGKNIDVCAAGDRIIGVFKGVDYVDAGGNSQFRPYWGSGQTLLSGSVSEAYVFDDPLTLFDVMVNGTTGLVAADVGGTANLAIGTGSQVTGQSADVLDKSGLVHNSTSLQLQVEELGQQTNNQYGQYARALVSIFLHYKRAAPTNF